MNAAGITCALFYRQRSCRRQSLSVVRMTLVRAACTILHLLAAVAKLRYARRVRNTRK